MSIDSERLRAASQLILGSAFSPEQCEELARTLGVVEEVLPWFALRRNAFRTIPQIEANFKAAAMKCPFPSSRRALPRDPARMVLPMNRELENALGAVIADNLQKSSLASFADAHLAQLTRISSAATTFDGQRRVTIDTLD